MPFSTSPFHLFLGLHFVGFCVKSASYIFLAFPASSNRSSCLIHLTLWSLMKSPRLTSLYNFLSSTLVLIRCKLSSISSHKIFLNIFLSKVIDVLSADLFMAHISAPWPSTGRITVIKRTPSCSRYIFRLECID